MALLFSGASPRTLTHADDHIHESYEVILTLEGEGISVIGTKEYPFVPGTIHIIPPRTIHSKTSASGFRDIFFHTDLMHPGNASSLQKALHHPVTLADDAAHTMRGLMTIMLVRYLKLKKYDPILESMYRSAVLQLNEWYENAPTDSVVDTILHHLASSFNDPEFSVTDALYATGYSKDYIRRRFFAATGKTPGEYLTNLRIQYAKQLLQQQSQLHLSIAEIGSMSGYYDESYFSRIFRKKEGMPPTAYAALYKNSSRYFSKKSK